MIGNHKAKDDGNKEISELRGGPGLGVSLSPT